MKVRFLVGLLGVFACAACRSTPAEEAPKPAPSAAPAPSRVTPIRPEDLPPELRVATAWPIPVGPKFAILAGQGLGPIRFGATVETIERLMEAPCEFRTEEACRYLGRGVEFFLTSGATTEIRIHRYGRLTTPKPRIFGLFNGQTPQGVTLTMVPDGVRGLLGPPDSVEPVTNGGEAGTVEIHHYKGIRLEFDKGPGGSLVLGGVVLTPDPKAKG